MVGVNPTAIAGAGNMLSAASVGVMLPIAGIGAILMPWIICVLAEYIGLQIGMLSNIVPCLGIFIFSMLCYKQDKAA